MGLRIQLTEKQQAVLDFIIQVKRVDGWPPTREEISKHFQWKSSNSAQEHLLSIERKGHIELTPSVSRGITIKKNPPK